MRVWLLALVGVVGCSSEDVVAVAAMADASVDAAPDGAGLVVDAGPDTADAYVCPTLTPTPSGAATATEPIGTGITGFCDQGCANPPHGYFTQDGGVPAVTGCKRLGTSNGFCCDEIKCTRNTSKDPMCAFAVPFGRPNAWACAAKDSDPTSPIASLPGNCAAVGPASPDLGIVYKCCDAP